MILLRLSSPTRAERISGLFEVFFFVLPDAELLLAGLLLDAALFDVLFFDALPF